MEKENTNKDNITRAISVLKNSVNKSILDNNEKRTLILLLDKLEKYYNLKLANAQKKFNRDSELIQLGSEVVDYIIVIDMATKGTYDVYQLSLAIKKQIENKGKRYFKWK